jgi:hypothetical protein
MRTAIHRRAPLPREFRLRGLGVAIPPLDLGIEYPLPRGAIDLNPLPIPNPSPVPIYPLPPVGGPAGAIPPGSYQFTSRNIYVDGYGNLNAECETISGYWVQSPPLYYLDCTGDISNQNGVLTCSHSGMPPFTPQNYIPYNGNPAQLTTQINPATGLPYTTIPNTGPQPPGAGYQQVEAPGNPYPYVYIGSGTAPAGSQYAIGQVPPGSYQQTSRNISVDQSGYLYAVCERIDGSWVQSPPLYYLNCVGDISNQDGVLTCGASSGISPVSPYYPYGTASPFPYGYPTYPSTSALNVPMPGGGVLNPTAPALSSGFGSQLSSFFSQYGLYIGLGVLGIFAFKALSGGRR